MKMRIIVGAVLLALAIGAVLWWNATFVRAPAKVWVGASGEARLRPFLAAERFAERMHVKTRELRSIPELDALAPGSALLLPAGRQTLDRERIERLLGWVQAGGHLIAEAEPLGTPDPLFDQLAVRRVAAPPATKPLAVAIQGRHEPLQVTLPRRLAIEPPTGRLELRAASGDRSASRPMRAAAAKSRPFPAWTSCAIRASSSPRASLRSSTCRLASTITPSSCGS
jgi:hypothetical protein